MTALHAWETAGVLTFVVVLIWEWLWRTEGEDEK